MKKKLELNSLSISSFVIDTQMLKGGAKPKPGTFTLPETQCDATGPCCDITYGCTMNTCDPALCEPFTI